MFRSARKLGRYCDHVTTGSTVGLFIQQTLYLLSPHRAEHTRARARMLTVCSDPVLSHCVRLLCVCVSGTPCLAHTPCVLEGRSTVCHDPPVSVPSTPPAPLLGMSAAVRVKLSLSITSVTHKHAHSMTFARLLRFISNRGHFIRIVWSGVTQPFVNARRCAA